MDVHGTAKVNDIVGAVNHILGMNNAPKIQPSMAEAIFLRIKVFCCFSRNPGVLTFPSLIQLGKPDDVWLKTEPSPSFRTSRKLIVNIKIVITG